MKKFPHSFQKRWMRVYDYLTIYGFDISQASDIIKILNFEFYDGPISFIEILQSL